MHMNCVNAFIANIEQSVCLVLLIYAFENFIYHFSPSAIVIHVCSLNASVMFAKLLAIRIPDSYLNRAIYRGAFRRQSNNFSVVHYFCSCMKKKSSATQIKPYNWSN